DSSTNSPGSAPAATSSRSCTPARPAACSSSSAKAPTPHTLRKETTRDPIFQSLDRDRRGGGPRRRRYHVSVQRGGFELERTGRADAGRNEHVRREEPRLPRACSAGQRPGV